MANVKHNLLTAGKVKAISKPGTYADGMGLVLRVGDGGAKSWVMRVTVDGKRKNIGLGGYPSVGLAEARRLAERNRQAVREGADPVEERRLARLESTRPAVPTFREATHECLKIQTDIKSEKHRKNWLQMMEKYAFPVIGFVPLDEIKPVDVIGVLTPIWDAEKQETARRIRQRMRSVFDWGMAYNYIESNPAGERISKALPKQRRDVNHFRALPYRELPHALTLIRDSKAVMASKLALEFVALTACRSGEARGARWSEIDWERKLWIIPGDRMKMEREHRVPLTAPSLALLNEAWESSWDCELVFPSPLKRGQALSDMTLTNVLRKAGLADRMTVHGLRSTFRDWAAEETATPWAVAELALAHQVGNSVEQAYHRTDLLEKRRELMELWAEFLTGRDGPTGE